MHPTWLHAFTLLGGILGPEMLRVSGLEISTSSEKEVVNGTDVRLKCMFTSRNTLSTQTVTVAWNFRPLSEGREESVFYYHDSPFPPTSGRFKDHVVWSGDILRGDASITLQEVVPTFNGTYICQVRNPPDVQGNNGEIILKVGEKVSLSEIAILAAAVGGASGVILLLVGATMLAKFLQRRRSEADVEMDMREKERKDPTVW